jgi:hypothetical protein
MNAVTSPFAQQFGATRGQGGDEHRHMSDVEHRIFKSD